MSQKKVQIAVIFRGYQQADVERTVGCFSHYFHDTWEICLSFNDPSELFSSYPV